MKAIIEPFRIKSYIDYVIECIGDVYRRRNEISGIRIVHEPPILRHFTARFSPL